MAEQTSIFNLISDALVEHLTETMIDTVAQAPDSDLNTPAGDVIAGRFRNDPQNAGIVIVINTGQQAWSHTLNLNAMGPGRSGFEEQAYEMGGAYPTVNNRLRYTADIRIQFSAETTEAEARRKAHLILSRLKWSLWVMRPALGPDSFGESAWAVEVNNDYIAEGGDTGGITWDGVVLMTFFTSLSPTEP